MAKENKLLRLQSNCEARGIKIYLSPVKDEFYVVKKIVDGKSRKVNLPYCTIEINDNGSIRKSDKRFKQVAPETQEAVNKAYEYYGADW